MALASVRTIGRAARLIGGSATPHELALGVVLGICLGLVPKTNLAAVLLCGAILALRANLSAAFATTLAVTGASTMLNGLAYSLGMTALTSSLLQPLWNWLFQQPLAPWLRFDDPIVLGHFLLGLGIAWPTYALLRRTLIVVQPGVRRWLGHSVTAQAAVGTSRSQERRAA